MKKELNLQKKRLSVVIVSLIFAVATIQFLPILLVSSSSACSPDFVFGTPTPATVLRGNTVLIGVSVTGVCGFSGSLVWSASVTAPSFNSQDGLTLHRATYHPIVLSPSQPTGRASFQAITTKNTLLTKWTITVSATDSSSSPCCLRHSVNLALTVDDFSISANPTNIKASVGQTVTSTVTATSINGFSGQIFYSGTLSPYPVSPESCNLQPPQPTLNPGGSVASSLTCNFDAKGTYTMFETAYQFCCDTSRNTTITFVVS
jgi:hypothetical protein